MKSYEEQIEERAAAGCSTAKYMQVEHKLQECYGKIRKTELALQAKKISQGDFDRAMFSESGLYQCKTLLESAREAAL